MQLEQEGTGGIREDQAWQGWRESTGTDKWNEGHLG